jgi:hypothetical protein
MLQNNGQKSYRKFKNVEKCEAPRGRCYYFKNIFAEIIGDLDSNNGYFGKKNIDRM